MSKTKKVIGLLLIITSPLLSPLSFASGYDQAGASSYLLAHANNPWSTMALSLLNTNSISSEYLKTVSSSKAIDYEAPILAITSLNKDPRTFASTDYVTKLESFHSGGQIGDSQTSNDDIFGILALISAGEPVSNLVISDAKNFLLAHQNTDGGWGFSVSSTSDSNTTASAIVALSATGLASSDTHIQSALNYLKTAQNNDGGFTYDPQSSFGTDSDSSSTAWVLWALNALKVDLATWTKSGNSPMAYLESNQAQTGFFKFQPGSSEDSFSGATTAYAVIALSGNTLPVHIFNPSSQSQGFAFRIEGSQDTVCTGQAPGPTALDIIKNASAQCGFTYNIQATGFGPYLNQINSDTASGLTGWLYLVNNIGPDVGAADYQLKIGDQVLWYFGEFGSQPTRISLTQTQISSGQSDQATVESFKNGVWTALSGATVTVGTKTFTTDSNGQASLNGQDGYYKVFASEAGYIGSNQVLLQIGQPNSASINLSVNVNAGQVNGTSTQGSTIAFTVDQNSLDFGTLTPGSSGTKQVRINNTGGNNLHVEAIVSGNDLFINNLNINNLAWQSFKTKLNSGQNENESLKLSVPQNYTGGSGQKNGQLIFWASAE